MTIFSPYSISWVLFLALLLTDSATILIKCQLTDTGNIFEHWFDDKATRLEAEVESEAIRRHFSDNVEFEPLFKLMDLSDQQECDLSTIELVRQTANTIYKPYMQRFTLERLIGHYLDRIKQFCEHQFEMKFNSLFKQASEPANVVRFKEEFKPEASSFETWLTSETSPLEDYIANSAGGVKYPHLMIMQKLLKLAEDDLMSDQFRIINVSPRIKKFIGQVNKIDEQSFKKFRLLMERYLYEPCEYIDQSVGQFVRQTSIYINTVDDFDSQDYGRQFVSHQPNELKLSLYYYQVCSDILDLEGHERQLIARYFA